MFGSLSGSLAGRHSATGFVTTCDPRQKDRKSTQANHGCHKPACAPPSNLPTTPATLLACSCHSTIVAGQAAQSSAHHQQGPAPVVICTQGTLTACHAPAGTPPPATPAPSAAAATQDLCSSDPPSKCGLSPAHTLPGVLARCAAAERHLYTKKLSSRVLRRLSTSTNQLCRKRKLCQTSSRPHQSA